MVAPISADIADWLQSRHQAVLVTLRKDGSPQTSNLVFAFDGSTARISVTSSRAKTHNVQRDSRVLLHVVGDVFWNYLSMKGTGVVSAETTEPGDAVGRELLEVYEMISGPHPDPDEFFEAMVDQQRRVLTVTPVSAVGYNVP